jgi:putative ABC transport system substrate-binding protein
MREAATRAGIALTVVYAQAAAEYPGAFAALRAAAVEALVIGNDPHFAADSAALAALALQARLPTSCDFAFMVRDGCMLSYGPDLGALRRRMAAQIARIFGGTSPDALPIEQPTTFETVVNLRTARALGVTLPPAVLARADEVIE